MINYVFLPLSRFSWGTSSLWTTNNIFGSFLSLYFWMILIKNKKEYSFNRIYIYIYASQPTVTIVFVITIIAIIIINIIVRFDYVDSLLSLLLKIVFLVFCCNELNERREEKIFWLTLTLNYRCNWTKEKKEEEKEEGGVEKKRNAWKEQILVDCMLIKICQSTFYS